MRKRIRYRAEQSIVVTVRDVSKLGPLLDAVASAGADAVGEPDYGFADPSVGRMQATRAAMADARRRADDAAAVAGLRITGVRTVVLDPGSDTEFESRAATPGGGASQRRHGADAGLGRHAAVHRARAGGLHGGPGRLTRPRVARKGSTAAFSRHSGAVTPRRRARRGP